MDEEVFRRSAQLIARRNLNDRINRVLANFNSKDGMLNVIYCVEGDPSDDDIEECEITCAELIAEFPEIREARTLCVSVAQCEHFNVDDVVFSKR
ncbi:hypothetical protein [Phenylobacterium sp.]|uniref:hypothetical protein n=1 Tax=Phenylobacterium sp. TaxID=1871053 RepID=UPI0030F3FF97